MKFKDYLLIVIILLFISILFVPTEKISIAIGIIISGIVLLLIYLLIRKK